MKRSITTSGWLAALFLIALPVVAQEPESQDDVAGVTGAVQAYFEGITQHDAGALRRAFAPQARLMFVRPNGSIYESSFADWSTFAERPPSPLGKVNHLVSIDLTGTAAVAKTELFWPGVHYVDYLSLPQDRRRVADRAEDMVAGIPRVID